MEKSAGATVSEGIARAGTWLRHGAAAGALAIALVAGPAIAALTPLPLPATGPKRDAATSHAAPSAPQAPRGPVAPLDSTLQRDRASEAIAAAKESGIPKTEKQTTAAPVSPAAMPAPLAHPARGTDPLPVFRPVYPYGGLNGKPVTPAVQPVTTLAQAIALAYKSNPRLSSQRATLRAADHNVAAARAAYGPSLDLQGSYGFTHDWNDTIFGTQSNDAGWTTSAAAILTQPLMTFGRNRAAESGAQAQVQYYRDTLRLVESQVLLAVITDYVSVIRDATAVSIARQNAAILGLEQEDDSARFKVREITRTDLDQVDSRQSQARATLLQAEGQLAISQAQFLRDVGAPPGELAPPDLLSVPAQTLDAAFAVGDVESPVIRAAQSREKISRAQLEAAKAEMMPRVDLRGTAALGTLTPYSDMQRTRRLSAEVVATVPVLDSGRRSSRVASERESNNSDWLLIDQAMRETRASVAAAWDQMVSSRASLEYYIHAVEASRQAYEGGRIEERAGARTTLEVLDLARDLLYVQTNYNTALANEYLARANLLAAMGRLEAPRLLPDINTYDPHANFRKVAHVDDLPLFTPVLRTLDGAIVGGVHGDRPIRDQALTVQATSPMPLPPESAAQQVDPTAIDLAPQVPR